MKYKIGTMMKANMVGSKLPNDYVTAEIIGYNEYNEYYVQLIFSHPERVSNNRKSYYQEEILDKWLSDDWKIVRTPPNIKLDDDLFKL